jgi:hypothetical protein
MFTSWHHITAIRSSPSFVLFLPVVELL